MKCKEYTDKNTLKEVTMKKSSIKNKFLAIFNQF